jgi:GNAT superfamily N-acetyltransferase
MICYFIRPCTPADLPEVVSLCRRHADHECASYDESGKIARLNDLLFGNDPRLHCWIVDVDGTASGYCTFTIDYSTWHAAPYLHMDCLYLDAPLRGAGIGRVILKKLREVAIAERCISIQWQTPAFNEGAIRFYTREGAKGNEKIRFELPVGDILW